MSYATIRAAVLAAVKAALGTTWTVVVGARQGDIDLEHYSGLDRVALLIPTSNELLSLVELGGSSQEGWRQWLVVYGVRYQSGREAEADLILQAAMEVVRTGLAGVCIDDTCGPLERTVETNLTDETVRLAWSQGWRHEIYPG